MKKEVKDQNEVATKDQAVAAVNPSDVMPSPKAVLESELERKRQEIVAANEEIANLRKEMQRLEKIKGYDDMSKDIKDIHDSLMRQGFSDDQAFQLVMEMVYSVNSAARNNPYRLR